MKLSAIRDRAAILLTVVALGLVPRPIHAQPAPGVLSGTVRDADGERQSLATVLVLETPLGALTTDNGTFRITGVPPGSYTIKVLKMGFDSVELRGVAVTSGGTASVEVTLKPSVVTRTREIVVEGRKGFIQKESSTARQVVNREDLESLPIDTIRDAIGLKAGVVSQAGELHFRGGRSNEVLYQIDGIPVRDPLGGKAVDIGTSAFSDAEALLGGLDAEYGNAQSGIVNISTREGGARFSGEVVYSTDDYGAPDKTYNNLDRVEVGFGGPLMGPSFTFFSSFQGTLQDTYLKTSEQRPRTTILDLVRLGPRQSNDFHYQAKLALNAAPNLKMTLEYLNTRNRRDEYSHVFSRTGFVQTRVDTLSSGDIETRYGRFSPDQEDSTFVPWSGPAQTPNISEGFDQVKMVWTHTLTPQSLYTVKLSRHTFRRKDEVDHKLPWEYEGRYPAHWRNDLDSFTEPFFATHGDVPLYLDRLSKTWTFKSDYTSQAGSHRIKAGLEGIYNDLGLLSITNPQIISPEGSIGSSRSQYRYYSPEGALYVQDRWLHEGMVVNLGARVDVFSVGRQLDESEVADPVRREFSPRLGFAYPVSDRDVFSFHYGHFSQIPDRTAIFENRNSEVLTRGNPNLESQTTVSYQIGLQHQFAPDVFGQFGAYFKDIFGLLAVEEVRQGDDPERFNQYVNRDYATARGFEFTLEKRFKRGFSADISYSYGLATGVASDPDQNRVDDLQYLPLGEQPLDWDQRHTLSVRTLLSSPGDWVANAIWSFGSGFPYTPSPRNQRREDPSLRNSGRLPSTTSLAVQFEKHYSVYGQDMKLFLRGDNVLDTRNIAKLEPVRFPEPPGFTDDIYAVYYTETGKLGGAYLGPDTDGDGIDEWVPLNDPRVFTEGRSIRAGVGVKF